MDGFAVRSADGTAPRRIAGAIRMGAAPPAALGAGEAMRIPTGGVLPAGADTVVPIEDADEQDGTVVPREAPRAGDSFTPRGDDMGPGDLVIAAGRRIGAPDLSVLATLGFTEVEVFARPRVAIVSTGDELVDVAARPATGQVRDSNRWAIAGGPSTCRAPATRPTRSPAGSPRGCALRTRSSSPAAPRSARAITSPSRSRGRERPGSSSTGFA
jgi:molybdopterin molybdotransferase